MPRKQSKPREDFTVSEWKCFSSGLEEKLANANASRKRAVLIEKNRAIEALRKVLGIHKSKYLTFDSLLKEVSVLKLKADTASKTYRDAHAEKMSALEYRANLGEPRKNLEDAIASKQLVIDMLSKDLESVRLQLAEATEKLKATENQSQ